MEDITEYLHGLQVRKYMFYFKRPHKHEVLSFEKMDTLDSIQILCSRRGTRYQ